MTAGPGWKTIRPSPIEPRTAAGTAVHACGWALKRVDRWAIRPQPSPKARSTDPVTSGSEPPDARVKTRATARAAPATREPRIAGTGERVLVARDESFMRSPPRMRANGLAVGEGRHDAAAADARSGVPTSRRGRSRSSGGAPEEPDDQEGLADERERADRQRVAGDEDRPERVGQIADARQNNEGREQPRCREPEQEAAEADQMQAEDPERQVPGGVERRDAMRRPAVWSGPDCRAVPVALCTRPAASTRLSSAKAKTAA